MNPGVGVLLLACSSACPGSWPRGGVLVAVTEGAAGDVGEDLLRDGVVTVLRLGLDNQLERRIGEHRVVAPDREQLVLPVSRLLVQVPDPADDQPGGDGLALLQRERRLLRFGDLGVRDPGLQLVVPDRAGTGSASRHPRRWRPSRHGCSSSWAR